MRLYASLCIDKGAGMTPGTTNPCKKGETMPRPTIDRDRFREAFETHQGDPKQTAAALGISKATFYQIRREIFPESFQTAKNGLFSASADQEAPKASRLAGAGLGGALGALEAALEQALARPAGLDEEKVKEIVLRSMEGIRSELLATQPKYLGLEIRIGDQATRKVDGIMPAWFKDALGIVNANLPLLLVGPAGSGKTHCAGKLAEALGLRFGFISLTAGISEAQLTGWLVPGKGGEFVYLPAQFVDFYENGGLFLLDEVDAADPNVLTVINAAIANGHLAIQNRQGNPVAVRHKDFRIIAAANTFGHGATRQYVGRNALDAATLDRFHVIEATYSDQVEEAIVSPEILRWGHNIRARIADHGLRRIMSTRKLKDYTALAACGWTIDRLESLYYVDWTAEEKAKVSR